MQFKTSASSAFFLRNSKSDWSFFLLYCIACFACVFVLEIICLLIVVFTLLIISLQASHRSFFPVTVRYSFSYSWTLSHAVSHEDLFCHVYNVFYLLFSFGFFVFSLLQRFQASWDLLRTVSLNYLNFWSSFPFWKTWSYLPTADLKLWVVQLRGRAWGTRLNYSNMKELKFSYKNT